jgi:hypothetical protein
MRATFFSSILILSGFVSSNAMAVQSLAEAKKAVLDYQILREACSDATGAKRLECMSRLSSASESYREAKTFVLASQSSNSYPVAKAH